MLKIFTIYSDALDPPKRTEEANFTIFLRGHNGWQCVDIWMTGSDFDWQLFSKTLHEKRVGGTLLKKLSCNAFLPSFPSPTLPPLFPPPEKPDTQVIIMSAISRNVTRKRRAREDRALSTISRQKPFALTLFPEASYV